MLNESGITLKQGLELEVLKEAKVISGSKGLKNVINGVNIMEVPDIVNWVKSGELLLTTAYSFKDNKKALTKLIVELHKKELAGIAIKTKRYIENIPSEVIDVSNRMGFPIIELPFDITFSDITSALLREIFNKQTSILLKLELIHKKLMDVVLCGGGLKDICIMLSGLLENPLILKDYVFGKHMYLKGKIDNEKLHATINRILKARYEFENTSIDTKEPYIIIKDKIQKENTSNSIERYIFPIVAGKKIFGEIQVIGANRRINGLDVRAIQNTCSIIALELMKQINVFEVESRHKNEFIEELMSRDEAVSGGAIEKAGLFGLDERHKYIVLSLYIEDIQKHFNEIAVNNNTWHKSKLIQAIEDEAHKSGERILIGSKGANITILIGYSTSVEDTEIKDLSMSTADRLLTIVNKKFPQILSYLGLSRSYNGLSNLYRGNEEARKAVSFSKIFKNRSIIHYDDLGIFRLLCMEHQEQEIKKFCHETVMPLVEYDKNKDGELIKTLRTYFECSGNLKQVCKKMYIHYNTILYRMQKIQTITGMKLDDSNNRLNMEISLKIMSMIDDVFE